MAFAEYAHYDALGLAELVAKKQVTPLELAEEAIARIEKHNPLLNAVVRPLYEYGRGIAAAPGDGPFRGVPFLLKDILGNVAGVPTQSGARFLVDLPSPQDDTLVVRFKAAGLVPLAKTNVPEFGLLPTTEGVLYGAAHNPWSLRHSTGGSSWRLGGGGRGRHRADGARQRRRRLDPHSRLVLRPRRAQAEPCPQSTRPHAWRHHERPDLRGRRQPHRARHRGDPRLHRRSGARRSVHGRAAGAAVRRGGADRRRVGCGSRSRPATPPAPSSIRNASPPSRRPPACARSSATSSKRRRRRSTRTR
jgi:hypothetical protein